MDYCSEVHRYWGLSRPTNRAGISFLLPFRFPNRNSEEVFEILRRGFPVDGFVGFASESIVELPA